VVLDKRNKRNADREGSSWWKSGIKRGSSEVKPRDCPLDVKEIFLLFTLHWGKEIAENCMVTKEVVTKGVK